MSTLTRHRAPLVALAFLTLAGIARAQTPPPPMPDDIRPVKVSAVGLGVSDLERSRKFYTEILGMKVDGQFPAKGPAQEYLLGYTGDLQADNLIVIRQTTIQPGASTFGRVVLLVPSGRKLAERVKAAGYDVPKIVDGVNVIKDPDGFVIELYQRPTPK